MDPEFQTVVEELKQLEPIEQYLTGPGKGSGNQIQYACPFCGNGANGGRGSFTVYKNTNTYYCFDCKKSGDVINFICETEGREFIEVVKELAAKHTIELPKSEKQRKPANHIEADPETGRAKIYPVRYGFKGAMMDGKGTFYYIDELTPEALEWIKGNRSEEPETFFKQDIEQTGEEQARKAPETHQEAAGAAQATATDKQTTESETAATGQNKTNTVNYTEYTQKAAEKLFKDEGKPGRQYLQGRGIDESYIALTGIGFDCAWISPTVIKGQIAKKSGWLPPSEPRLIIPTDEPNCYIAQSLKTPEQLEAEGKSKEYIFTWKKSYRRMNETGGGEIGYFDPLQVLKTDAEPQTVFIVEGYMDALSIIQAGAAAVAINSTNNAKKFLNERIEARKLKQHTYIICGDNDKAGREMARTLRDGLELLNISFLTADLSGGIEKGDANDFLQADREGFIQAVAAAVNQAGKKPDTMAAYMDLFFNSDIEEYNRGGDIQTGFPNLDEKAGGLFPKLYILAAAPATGKTTFCLQMANQIAATGRDVIYFSMEQTRHEMLSKSLAYLTAKQDFPNAVKAEQIQRGEMPEAARKAFKDYRNYIADHMNIIEGNFDCNLSYISDYIRRYIKNNDCRPVIFVDYLQILQPEHNDRGRLQDEREKVNAVIVELKRLSRRYRIPIIVISAINRQSNYSGVKMDSARESSGIEYTAEVFWGLQYSIVESEDFKKITKDAEKEEILQDEKGRTPARYLELKCSKNRGGKDYKCYFLYYPDKEIFFQSAKPDFPKNEPGEEYKPKKKINL